MSSVNLASVESKSDRKVIVVGVLGPLSTVGGRGMLNGVLMAVEDLNKRGGVLGRRLAVSTYDDSEAGVSIPDKSALGYVKLVDENKVSLVVGPYSSHCALKILDLLPKKRVMIVTSGAVADVIDQRIIYAPWKYKYFFRTLMNASSQAMVFWQYFRETIIENFDVRKVAVFYENLVWTNAHLAILEKMAEQNGVEIGYMASIDPVKPNFTPKLRKVKHIGAQAIIELFSLVDTSLLVKKWADLKVPAILTGGDVAAMDINFWEKTGGKCYSQIVVHYGFRAPITSKTINFYDRYLVRFGQHPNFQCYYAYDAVMIWASAVERIGIIDPDKIHDELLRMEYEGVGGKYKFDSSSHSVHVGPDQVTGLYIQWQSGGKRVPVWPKRLRPSKEISVVLPPWMVDGMKGEKMVL